VKNPKHNFQELGNEKNALKNLTLFLVADLDKEHHPVCYCPRTAWGSLG